MRILVVLSVLLGAWLTFVCHAEAASTSPSYQPAAPVSGELRIWGSPEDRQLLQQWADGFRKFHSEVRFSLVLHGPDSTMAGLYNGVADIAFMARELRLPVESMAFEWEYHYKPFSIEVANGSVSSARPGTQLAVIVNRQNPLRQLTLVQLDAILGAEHLRSAAAVTHWGELGLQHIWRDRPIHPYGPSPDSIAAMFIRKSVLNDSYKWSAAYQETPDDDAVVATVAADPAGIGYASLHAIKGHAGVRVLSLAADTDQPFCLPGIREVMSRCYPLTRSIPMIVNRPPDQSIAALVKEFLRYILSREGQAVVARTGGLVPLSDVSVTAQRARLE